MNSLHRLSLPPQEPTWPKQVRHEITIDEPGDYLLPEVVNTITCVNSRFTVSDGFGVSGLGKESIYAPSKGESQWLSVWEHNLKSGPLQFIVMADEGVAVDLSQHALEEIRAVRAHVGGVASDVLPS
ncbi:MAG: hypothetical protein O3B47_02300 [bacterium]|nr:hypothetical protein [bacterium]